jgi:RNA polymerase sigma-70 factor (ECF subfamily)
MSDEERTLIRRAKAGDCDAFAEIYDRHQPAIYRYIAYRVSTDAVAEDLTSEVFVRLVDRIDDFTYRGRPILAWLYTIARNLVNDHHRRNGRNEIVPLDETLKASTPDPEGVAKDSLDFDRCVEALDQLTDGQREVIILKFLEGLDNQTVAQLLDKSYGAVKALQHRGLASMRRWLDA